LKNGIDRLSLGLAEPQTRLAALSTPIHAPDVKVEPRRSVIAVAALLGGALLGVLVAIGRRVLRRSRAAAAA
jgi:LPS O-antigen subunit length determinant protein (WzzB/FepE family)